MDDAIIHRRWLSGIADGHHIGDVPPRFLVSCQPVACTFCYLPPELKVKILNQ
ncbi:Hypothetical predicted protein [Scomber scombrus]|uniref:Uncharacterized protein n=1 Tax=Scomber scombrus TaxID=13677 RepID=A0AAV1NI38_SCOSC